MPSAVDKVLEDALALPEDDRERVADVLLGTLHRPPHPEVEAAWDAEALHRVRAAERDRTPALDWDEAVAAIRARHSGE